MSKKVLEMTDRELMQAYLKGKEWLINNEQVSKTDKNKEGKDYDPAMYLGGLCRIEEIEKEMIKRGMRSG